MNSALKLTTKSYNDNYKQKNQHLKDADFLLFA